MPGPWSSVGFTPLLAEASEVSGAVLNFSPSLRWLLGTLLTVYLLLMLAVSWYAKGRVETEEDFLVAGRRLGLFLAWGSLISAWFGASAISGAAGAARAEGLRGVVLDPFACAATLVFTGLVFAAPLWRMKLLTIGDFYRRVYGPTTEVLCSVIVVPAYFGWIAAQFKALGIVLDVYFGVPLVYGILFSALITLVFTSVGGMWSVTLTDTLQILIAMVGLVVLGSAVFAMYGNGSATAGVQQMVEKLPPDYLTLLPVATAAGVLGWTGTVFSGVFGCTPGQDLLQRIFSANSPRTARLTCVIAGFSYLAIGMIPVGIGLLSSLTDPGLHEDQQDHILQFMVGKYLSPAMAVLFVVSYVSILVSTACSAVLAPATILAHNTVSRLGLFPGRGLVMERVCVLLVSAGGMILACTGSSIMDLLDFNLSVLLSALFVPLLLGLYGRPRSPWCGILAMVCGLAAYIGRSSLEVALWPIEEGWETVPLVGYGVPSDILYASGLPTLVRLAAIIPADLYGFGASFLGYFLGQWIGRGRPPLNDNLRQIAFDRAGDPGRPQTQPD